MRESLLVVPVRDNDGNSLAHVVSETARKLAKQYNGVTLSEGEGLWIDPETGKEYNEPVTLLTSAYDETKPENDAFLAETADWLRVIAKQEAVYIRYASGNVEVRNGRNL